MAKYTIILDYAGGTYLAQTESADERQALAEWVQGLRSAQIAGEVSKEVSRAFEAGSATGLSPVTGLTNVWCESATGANGLAVVNVIATASWVELGL